jgi:hypothetical protein
LVRSFATEKRFEISKGVNDAQDFLTVLERPVKDQDSSEALDWEPANGSQLWVARSCVPAQLSLCSEQTEGVVSRKKKTVIFSGATRGREVLPMIVQVSVGLGSDERQDFV